MNKRSTLSVVSIGLATSLLFGAFASNLTAQESNPMVEMAMANMRKVMMMPKEERMSYVMQAQADSLSHGKALFEDNGLGTNGQACQSCHVGGRTTGGQVEMMPGMAMQIPDLHGVAGTFPKFKPGNDAVITLSEMNNNCLVMFQAGQPLALGSEDARDLASYVSSLTSD